jgi:hypothetical protein
MWQKMLTDLWDSISFEGLLHNYCSTYTGPALVLAPTLVAKEKVVRFSDYQGYGKLL